MRHIIKGAIVAAVFMIYNIITSHIEILGIAPSLMIVLAVAYSLSAENEVESLIYSVVIGTLMDIVWGRVFGLWTVLFMYAGVMVYFAGEYFYKNTAVKAAFITFAAAIFIESAFYLANFTLFGNTGFVYMLFRTIIPAGAYNAILQLLFNGWILKYIPEKKRSEAL